MGYDINRIEYFLSNKKIFQNKKILTLGVLYPYYYSSRQKQKIYSFGLDPNDKSSSFSQKLFIEKLDAKCVDVIDVDDYQGAELIHNLNLPINNELKNHYDIVIDAGTTEHISNHIIAFNNYFSLLKIGGIYLFGAPCNGWVNHGFVQYSPTFYKDLCDHNCNVIELKSLSLSTPTDELSIIDSGQNLITSYINSHKKVNIGGAIIKHDSFDNLDFNFIQSKYKKWHSTGDATTKNSSLFIIILRRCFNFFITTSFIPFGIKKFVLGFTRFYQT